MLMNERYLKLLRRIPERHYFPIFLIISLYFVIPYSEFVVTALAPLYFIFEKQIRWVSNKLPLPSYLRLGASIVFFLVMIDDYLFYFAIMVFSVWITRKLRKKDTDSLTYRD